MKKILLMLFVVVCVSGCGYRVSAGHLNVAVDPFTKEGKIVNNIYYGKDNKFSFRYPFNKKEMQAWHYNWIELTEEINANDPMVTISDSVNREVYVVDIVSGTHWKQVLKGFKDTTKSLLDNAGTEILKFNESKEMVNGRSATVRFYKYVTRDGEKGVMNRYFINYPNSIAVVDFIRTKSHIKNINDINDAKTFMKKSKRANIILKSLKVN